MKAVKPRPLFDAGAFLRAVGAERRVVTYQSGDIIFFQGHAADSIFYLKDGAVKLSVVSRSGKEATIALLGPGDFFGETALAGHSVWLKTATAQAATIVLVVPKEQMRSVLHEQHALSDRFIQHLLARNIRIEEDLVDQLFNSTEKRLARALLLLARYGKPNATHRELPRVSQETLAGMIGTTRSRVNFFMNRFKRLGFIEYNGGLKVHHSLLTVVLHD